MTVRRVLVAVALVITTMTTIPALAPTPVQAVTTFKDVPGGHTFATEIDWLVSNGITTGFGDGTFRPTASVTRQATAAFLYRFAHRGADTAEPCTTKPFSDVPVTHPFCGEITWMVSNGITTGFSDGTFGGTRPVTRQAMASFVSRFAVASDQVPPCTSAAFADVPTSHPFCAAIAWMTDVGLSSGYSDGTFRPTAVLARQAMAAFLYRLDSFGEPVTPTVIESISAGGEHTCGLRTDGAVTCWGADYYGQATPPSGGFAQVAAGGFHTCGLRTDGTVTCWGTNDGGRASPPTGAFVHLASGTSHTCGLRVDGTASCWGRNDNGEASPPSGAFIQLSARGSHVCGLRTVGTVTCWGTAFGGQASPPAGTFTQVAAGWGHACGLRVDGTAICWGSDYAGQATAPGGTFTQLTAGFAHSCGLRVDGAVTCWGYDEYGEATAPAGAFSQISAGDGMMVFGRAGSHSCGLRTDGTVACWGHADYGADDPPPGTSGQP